jgi:hypothetical protein
MSSKIVWPPNPYNHGADTPKNDPSNIDGEGSWIYLRRFENDQTLHGRQWTSCCDCGLEHLYAFSVLRTRNGQWWLIKRAWWLIKRAYRDYKTSNKKLKDIKRKE